MAVIVIWAGMTMPAAQAADSIDNLTQELIDLRGEVQRLNDELDLKREQHKSRMQSLERQRGESEVRVKREKLKLTKLEKTLKENRKKAAQAGVAASDLQPVLEEAIGMARARIQSELPFKVAERVAELDEMAQKINTGALPAHKATNHLWAFYEDELRLTRANGIYRQPVVIDREETLADVARLGMMMLYFETSDGRYGAAVKGEQGWTFDEYYDRDDKKRVSDLFDQLRKQIRTGYFEIPNTLPGMEAAQ